MGKKSHRDIQGFQNDFQILPTERFSHYECECRWRIFGITKFYSRNSGGAQIKSDKCHWSRPEIERRIRVVKEKSRAMRHSLHFNRITKLTTIHAILKIGKMLNYFPTKGGITIDMSPWAILNGENLNYNKHLKLQFRQYFQVHKNETPHNRENARTQGVICLVPSGNQKVGYRFMSLNTKKSLGTVGMKFPCLIQLLIE